MKSIDEDKLIALKNVLKEHTFVGEYLGGFFNQHITYEKDEKLIFYGVVKKSSFKNDLMPFRVGENLITRFGLEFVPY